MQGEGRRIALLGFAGGGMMAPIRAMGLRDIIHAVDLSLDGFRLFKRLCRPWAEPVAWHHGDAIEWLRASRGAFDLIVDDLSISHRRHILKPEVTWTDLPGLVRRALAPEGVAVFNLLEPRPGGWEEGLRIVAAPFVHALEIRADDYENRILVVSDVALDAARVSRGMRRHLRAVRSSMASGFAVRTASRLASGGD